jgi:hypothetical protein
MLGRCATLYPAAAAAAAATATTRMIWVLLLRPVALLRVSEDAAVHRAVLRTVHRHAVNLQNNKHTQSTTGNIA